MKQHKQNTPVTFHLLKDLCNINKYITSLKLSWHAKLNIILQYVFAPSKQLRPLVVLDNFVFTAEFVSVMGVVSLALCKTRGKNIGVFQKTFYLLGSGSLKVQIYWPRTKKKKRFIMITFCVIQPRNVCYFLKKLLQQGQRLNVRHENTFISVCD